MSGIGKIIGGVILLLVGIIAIGGGMTFSSIQSNLERCNTFTGQLGQSLDPETAEICASAPAYQGTSNAAIIVGLILSVLGIVLIILGAVSRSKHKKEKEVENIISPRKEDSVVSYTKKLPYCRYCGKQREASGEFCSMCGRSSHSSSTTLKKCTSCNTTMSEDSEFCANCAQKFEERTTITEGTKRFYYTSDGKRKERS